MKSINVVAAILCKNNQVFATQRGYGAYKDWWEFPGGKVETGETPEDALAREIREELDAVIRVGDYIDTVEYDYPEFHLSMRCYWATIAQGELVLLEHEDARWLSRDELDNVNWLPADRLLLERIKQKLVDEGISSTLASPLNGMIETITELA